MSNYVPDPHPERALVERFDRVLAELVMIRSRLGWVLVIAIILMLGSCGSTAYLIRR